ncbi:pachytene checkpoint protein 2 homolog [Phalaenopsis equestris]|uniref:pachytene checkpoint protein 2 homolog n=1 Tax=Phalaenopsis equestris TaxID=78828 RepID=UPI0009E2CEBC|nr:pachytene checkpoint protein 2 homolog [Phalaenopsis equestris]
MDRLKCWPNVIILTTSNITAAIDIAFVDRADIKAYVGPPTLQARYEILRSCLQELLRTGILRFSQGREDLVLPNYSTLKEKLHASEMGEPGESLLLFRRLLEAAEACQGLSGRALRKLPFLAHAALTNPNGCDPAQFTDISWTMEEVMWWYHGSLLRAIQGYTFFCPVLPLHSGNSAS